MVTGRARADVGDQLRSRKLCGENVLNTRDVWSLLAATTCDSKISAGSGLDRSVRQQELESNSNPHWTCAAGPGGSRFDHCEAVGVAAQD